MLLNAIIIACIVASTIAYVVLIWHTIWNRRR